MKKMKTNKIFFNQVLNVTNAEYIGEYKVKLSFNEADLAPEYLREILQPLDS